MLSDSGGVDGRVVWLFGIFRVTDGYSLTSRRRIDPAEALVRNKMSSAGLELNYKTLQSISPLTL